MIEVTDELVDIAYKAAIDSGRTYDTAPGDLEHIVRAVLNAIVPNTVSRVHESLANELDPEVALPTEELLRKIHVDLEIRGRKDPSFAVTIHHRNIALSAVAKAIRSSHGMTWEQWLTHCGNRPSLWKDNP